MLKQIIFGLSVFIMTPMVFAQTPAVDTVVQLEETLVTGYLSQQPLLRTPTSVGIVNSTKLRQQSDATLLPALNSLPGVRMEERSPGSYRLSLRGSLLRSPWGVRNVKVYIDEFPLTDAGGNSYLNLIDTRNIDRIEVLKGPDGSLFGANSGGVVLLDPYGYSKDYTVKLGISGGSYGLVHQDASLMHQTKNSQFELSQAFLRSDGYREQSAMRRHYVQITERWNYNASNELKAFAFFADHQYETPGGLNEAQYNEDPRQARPAAGPNPGAVEQQAGIFNKTFFGGLSHEARFTDNLRHVASIFGSHTDFENPFITNYEEREELNYGVRTYLEFRGERNEDFDWKMNLGLEWQHSDHEIVNFDNLGNATKGALQAADEFQTDSHFYFTSFTANILERLTAEAAISLNYYKYSFEAMDEGIAGSSDFSPEWMPRLSLSYLLTPRLAWRASVSRGYSPPTTAEIRPSNIIINTDLQAETGWNYETGIRLNDWNRRFQMDASVFFYRMEEAIVRRSDEAGEEFFANAGGTDQLGLETLISYWLIEPGQSGFIQGLQLSNSATLSDFEFRDYVQGSDNYSGNRLTGVPRTVVVTSAQFSLPSRFTFGVQHNFTDEIPLNDANSVYADSYHLLQAKLGWSTRINGKYNIELYAGVDNLLNEKYSLGNDINAFGNRYYNAAPLRNYYGGLIFKL